MGVHRRAPAGVAVVVAGVALIAAGPATSSADSIRAATVKVASGPKLVRFFRPTGDTLVQKGTGPIRVIVQLRHGARLRKVDVDGVDVTRLLRRRPGPGGYYGALLHFSRHLHYGFNDAFVQARGRGGSRGFDHVRFIVAKRDHSLLRLTSFRTETAAAPLQVGLREATGTNVRAGLSVAAGVSARVYVNDRRVDRAFSRAGRRLFVRVGAAEGLRFGRNLVQILVHKTHPYKRQSSYDMESRRVYIGRGAPIASAGADRTITGRSFVRLNGRATKLPPGWTRRSFRWKIVTAPKGSKARLRNASGARPTVVPDRPGVYDVRVSVRGAPPGPARGLRAQDAAATDVSNDTATLTVQPDIPPAGVRLDTLSGHRGIVLDGKPIIEGGGQNEINVNYAVLDRRTLEVKDSGAVRADVDGIQQLGTIIDGYSGTLDDLIVLNWQAFGGGNDAERDALDTVLQKIGAERLTGAQRGAIRTFGDDDAIPGSAVGVAGAPAGSAFVTFASTSAGGGALSGYLRLNGAIGKFDFVFTDPVEFDTETNQTRTDDSPAKLTIKVGGSSETEPNPGGGASGFHLLVLDANTLGSLNQGVYATNAAGGAQQPSEVQRLASDLNDAVNNGNRPLVILQAFGAPHGEDGAWDEAAKAVERLGGTREVFDALNAVDPRPLNGEDAKRHGPYGFVGRVGSTAPLAEASYSLNGEPGRLRGLLMRAHDGGYEPMIAGPPRSEGQSPVNTELIHIADRAPQPFPVFKDANGQPIGPASAQAVQKFLGGPTITALCPTAGACDIRKSYYQSYHENWASVQDDLTNAEIVTCSRPHEGFTAAQCEGIASQLRDEVSMIAKVTQYFGPQGLQRPFGAAGATALANLGLISHDVSEGVDPPPADKTTSGVLDVLSEVLHIGGALAGGAEEKSAEVVAETLSGAFGLTAYFTEADGEQNLIGPRITTEASKLGVELQDRYLEAGNNLDDLGRLIVSDYGKLTAVASKINAPPGEGEFDWRLGNVAAATNELTEAAKRTIYERLVPLAYPVMYDLGDKIDNARNWYCDGGIGYNKHLFAEQADGAQFVGRFPATQWNPTIAVATAHAVGSLHDARILGVPASVTDELFKSPANGGLGLNKLEFYSPRNGFRWFPSDPTRSSKNGDTLHWNPYPDLNENLDASDVISCVEIPIPPDNSG